MTDPVTSPWNRPASWPRRCLTCSATTRRSSSSNMAAMPWARRRSRKQFASDIVLLEQTAINPVVVHGGGPQIAAMLKRLGIKSEFAAGLRITDAATIEIVEMVLAGSINKQIVGYINEAGGKAVGLCGKDGNMVVAKKVTRQIVDPDSNIEKVVDLGFVGESGQGRCHGAQPDPRPRIDPGAGADRNLEGRR